MICSVTLSIGLLQTITKNGIETIHSAKVRLKLDDVESQIKDLIYSFEMPSFSQSKIQAIDEQLKILEEKLADKEQNLLAINDVKQKWDQLKKISPPDKLGMIHELDLLHRAITTTALADIAKKEKVAENYITNLMVIRIVIGILIFLMILLAMYDEAQKRKQRDEMFLLLQESEKKAVEASRAKTMFLAIASHELRTPLNGIIGLSELLRKSGLPEKETHFIDNIYNSGKSLMKIINNILEFSRIESGKIELENADFNLSAAVFQIITTLSVKAHEKNLDLNFIIDKDVPSKLYGDASRLSQIIYNLVGNAIKFTAVGSVILKVKVQSIDPKKGLCLVFSVEDTGVGLTLEQQQKIFLPYNIVQSKGTSGEMGSGLGMAISMQLAKALGGELKVTSVLQKGSCFTFTAIFSKFSNEIIGEIELQHQEYLNEHKAITSIFNKENVPMILVVDDNPTNLLMAQEMLERLGAKIVTATNGREAITEYLNQKIDLILIDCQMPVMDGYEATSELRKLGAKIPILAMTANTSIEDQAKFFDCGMNGFITKPFSIKQLINDLTKILRQKA
jgi:signal transduction histidine kinase/CheY-like chemotaxis protein